MRRLLSFMALSASIALATGCSGPPHYPVRQLAESKPVEGIEHTSGFFKG